MQIAEQLRDMKWQYLFNGFEFKHDTVLDNKIQSISCFQFDSVVAYR